jgi:hypothetical protein
LPYAAQRPREPEAGKDAGVEELGDGGDLLAPEGEHDQPGEQEDRPRSEHDRPNITIHDMPRAVRLHAADAPNWVEYQADWEPVGVGCVKTIFCAPSGGT